MNLYCCRKFMLAFLRGSGASAQPEFIPMAAFAFKSGVYSADVAAKRVDGASTRNNMNGPLFARPSLKWFVIGSLLIAVVHQVTIQAHSQGPKFAEHIVDPRYRASNHEIQELLMHALEHPSTEAYLRVAACYQNRGETRRALLFLREAEKAGDWTD